MTQSERKKRRIARESSMEGEEALFHFQRAMELGFSLHSVAPDARCFVLSGPGPLVKALARNEAVRRAFDELAKQPGFVPAIVLDERVRVAEFLGGVRFVVLSVPREHFESEGGMISHSLFLRAFKHAFPDASCAPLPADVSLLALNDEGLAELGLQRIEATP